MARPRAPQSPGSKTAHPREPGCTQHGSRLAPFQGPAPALHSMRSDPSTQTLPVHAPRREHPTLMHHLHWRFSVLVYSRKHDLVLADDRVHVEYIAGHKLLQQIVRLRVTQFIERPP